MVLILDKWWLSCYIF